MRNAVDDARLAGHFTQKAARQPGIGKARFPRRRNQAHFVPRCVQFLGEHLRETGVRALPDIGVRGVNGNLIVFGDLQPSGKIMLTFAGGQRNGLARGAAIAQLDAEQSCTNDRHTTDQEGAAFETFFLRRGRRGIFSKVRIGIISHHAAPFEAVAALPVAAWIALRMRG